MRFRLQFLAYFAVFSAAVLFHPTFTYAQHYVQTNLVSDGFIPAVTTDGNLSNPWGLTRTDGIPWWVADNNTGVSSLYDFQGHIIPLDPPTSAVAVIPPPKGGTPPSAPSGTIFNGTNDFNVTPGNPAFFIFVTEDGTISGWNPAVDPVNAILKVDNSHPKEGASAVYKGCTIAQVDGKNVLLVTNFRTGRIEEYSADFKPVHLSEDQFDDDRIRDNFSPFNVQTVGRVVVVTYAKQDAPKHDPVGGVGLGFVDVFSTEGKLLSRMEHGDWFSAPWGITLTPQDFGFFSNTLLIGNFRGGQLLAFDPFDGHFLGHVLDANGKQLVIDGLWALAFGDGNTQAGGAGPANTLFFTAGPGGEKHGLFGSLTPVAAEQNNGEQ
jgi:uncharacterized protein (TIGR03118 family)